MTTGLIRHIANLHTAGKFWSQSADGNPFGCDQVKCTGLLGCPATRGLRQRREGDAILRSSTSISSPSAQTGHGEGSRGAVRVQASTSSSKRSTTDAEESSEAESEPKPARGQRRADGKADGDSRDWVRCLCVPCQSCPGQQLTSLRELPANPSMQTPAEHRVERRLCDAQSSARRDYTWSSTVPNGKSRYYCP